MELRETALVPVGKADAGGRESSEAAAGTLQVKAAGRRRRLPEAGQSEKSFGDGIGKVTVAARGGDTSQGRRDARGTDALEAQHGKHAAGLEPRDGSPRPEPALCCGRCAEPGARLPASCSQPSENLAGEQTQAEGGQRPVPCPRPASVGDGTER